MFYAQIQGRFLCVRIEGNKVEVKDNSGKLNWYHISDIKDTDMIKKLVCQLPDVDGFGGKGRLSFDAEHDQDLGWTPNDLKYRFNPDHVQDISGVAQDAPKQRSHLMQLSSASVNEVQTGGYRVTLFNAIEYIRHYGTLLWNKS